MCHVCKILSEIIMQTFKVIFKIYKTILYLMYKNAENCIL